MTVTLRRPLCLLIQEHCPKCGALCGSELSEDPAEFDRTLTWVKPQLFWCGNCGEFSVDYRFKLKVHSETWDQPLQSLMQVRFTRINVLLGDRDYAACNALLESINPGAEPRMLTIGSLRASYAARQHLPAWEPLLKRMRELLPKDKAIQELEEWT